MTPVRAGQVSAAVGAVETSQPVGTPAKPAQRLSTPAGGPKPTSKTPVRFTSFNNTPTRSHHKAPGVHAQQQCNSEVTPLPCPAVQYESWASEVSQWSAQARYRADDDDGNGHDDDYHAPYHDSITPAPILPKWRDKQIAEQTLIGGRPPTKCQSGIRQHVSQCITASPALVVSMSAADPCANRWAVQDYNTVDADDSIGACSWLQKRRQHRQGMKSESSQGADSAQQHCAASHCTGVAPHSASTSSMPSRSVACGGSNGSQLQQQGNLCNSRRKRRHEKAGTGQLVEHTSKDHHDSSTQHVGVLVDMTNRGADTISGEEFGSCHADVDDCIRGRQAAAEALRGLMVGTGQGRQAGIPAVADCSRESQHDAMTAAVNWSDTGVRVGAHIGQQQHDRWQMWEGGNVDQELATAASGDCRRSSVGTVRQGGKDQAKCGIHRQSWHVVDGKKNRQAGCHKRPPGQPHAKRHKGHKSSDGSRW